MSLLGTEVKFFISEFKFNHVVLFVLNFIKIKSFIVSPSLCHNFLISCIVIFSCFFLLKVRSVSFSDVFLIYFIFCTCCNLFVLVCGKKFLVIYNLFLHVYCTCFFSSQFNDACIVVLFHIHSTLYYITHY